MATSSRLMFLAMLLSALVAQATIVHYDIATSATDAAALTAIVAITAGTLALDTIYKISKGI